MEGSWGSVADGTFAESAIDMKQGTRGRLALQGAPCCPEMGETRVLWPQRGDQGGVGERLSRARDARRERCGFGPRARPLNAGRWGRERRGPGICEGIKCLNGSGRGLGRPGAVGGTENQEERRWRGSGRGRGGRLAAPGPAGGAAMLQLRALPAAAPLRCPGPSAAIEMEMPRAWRTETLFPA